MHLLSHGHCDCVGLTATGRHLVNLKSWIMLISQVFPVVVLRKRTPKGVQNGGYLAN